MPETTETKIYLIDESQLRRIKQVMSRLYNEMKGLSADDRRDLANALEAVTSSIEQLGPVDEFKQGQDK